MIFTTPIALLLLLTVPLTLWIGRPRARIRRGRDIASLIVRTIILLCLIAALAGAQIVAAADRLAVVFLVDGSDSMGGDALTTAYATIETALADMAPGDQAAVIVYGGDALIERPMSSAPDLAVFRSTPDRGNSDLEEAISLGLALFPSGAARRMVILSDGLQTTGDAAAAAERAAALDIPIAVIPTTPVTDPDVRLLNVRVPSVVTTDSRYDLVIEVESDARTEALIRVYAAGVLLETLSDTLERGVNRYVVPLTAGTERGFSDFQVQVEPLSADAFAQNDQIGAFTRVVGAPRILVLSDDPGDSAAIESALTAAGLALDVQTPDAAPIGPAALAGYDAVILNDVSASALAPARMAALQTYVEDLGGGLVVIGGTESYAPGGYFQTPLEEILPVEMRLQDQQRIPQLTIAYVIDRSGSMMAAGPSGVTNLDLAKESIIRSISFLQATDRAGVVSFDTDGFWVVDMQEVTDQPENLQNLVAGLLPGGGTDIMAGYRLAGEALAEDSNIRKHIVLLTDGGANDRGLIDLAKELNERFGITTSVIAIGVGTPDFLAGMASAGDGNFHAVDVVETIPSIFSQETVLATRAYYMENRITLTQTALHPILSGIDGVPPLLGYVATTPKDLATVILSAPEPYPDPIVAAWQRGLGRTVAITTDAVPRWSAEWLAWDGYPTFLGQAVRWTIDQTVDRSLEARILSEGDQARIIVDARTPDDAFANGLTLETLITAPDGQTARLTLRQTAPGRYEGVFSPDQEGAYFVRTRSETAVSPLSGWVRRYSAEYAGGGVSILPTIAELTGGELGIAPEAIFSRRDLALNAETPLAPILLLIALLLLPIDIAVRRLLVTRGDVSRLLARVRPQRATPHAPSERMSTLLDAKARASAPARDAALPEVPIAPPPPSPVVPPSAPVPQPPTPATPAVPPAPSDESGNLAGRLLQRRRDRGGDGSA